MLSSTVHHHRSHHRISLHHLKASQALEKGWSSLAHLDHMHSCTPHSWQTQPRSRHRTRQQRCHHHAVLMLAGAVIAAASAWIAAAAAAAAAAAGYFYAQCCCHCLPLLAEGLLDLPQAVSVRPWPRQQSSPVTGPFDIAEPVYP